MHRLRADIPSSMSVSTEPLSEGDSEEGDRTEGRDVNPYLYENLVSNFEGQIAHWTRQAASLPDDELAKSYRLKAEGLEYALRLLNAFEEEFRELTDCALHHAPEGKS
jgi:hypothetical protein